MRRAAFSIPCNIAEGQGRKTTKDFLHFLAIAYGSLRELETQVILAQRLGYLDQNQKDGLFCATDQIGRLINGLVRSLKSKLP